MQINKKVKENFFILKENKNVKASWFGIPIILSKKLNRKKVVVKLEKNGIETRPIISGNFLKQPAIKKYKIKTNLNLKNADYVDKHGLYISLPNKKIDNYNLKKLITAFEKSI